MQHAPIIIYDSGVGGLTVARQLMKYCPGHDLIYLADNAWFPYGNKDESLVAARVEGLIALLNNCLEPRAVVVACNTASTALADRHQRTAAVPLYGVIPPVESAMSLWDGGRIALLATPATLERNVVRRLVATYDAGQFVSAGCMDLVYLAERKMADPRAVDAGRVVEVLDARMPAAVREEVTTIILGCTHFPLLLPELREAFPNARRWLDPATEVARAVAKALPRREGESRLTTHSLLLTGAHNYAELRRVFAAQGFSQTALLDSIRRFEEEAEDGYANSLLEGGALLPDRHGLVGGYVPGHDERSFGD